MNELLHGHNSDERIVAVHQQDDSTMRLYFRDGPSVRHIDDAFFPFFFLSEKAFLEGYPRRHWIKNLEGEAYYRYLCAFEEWSHLWEAVRHVLDHHNRAALTKVSSYNELDIVHLHPDPVSQYLLQTGRTLFKGMTLDDLHRLQLDIETYTTTPHRFSNANRPGDAIILIALSDTTGWEFLLNGKEMDEPDLLRELVRIIRERDPDVIEGHNIYGFDLPYLLRRCEFHKIPFAIGRDGSSPRSFDSRSQVADRVFDYTVTEIPGRHIIDTLMLVQSHDMSRRDMESHGLKYAAQYFGVASADRTYIKGEKISWHWDHEVEPLVRYAMDDVRETRGLSEQLSGTSFYLTQMLPHNYGHVARMGSAAKIESLMVREYLRLRHALPKPQEGTQTTGGYTDVFVVGIVGPVLHVDVESLYPSIMLSRKIAPSSDHAGVFQALLQHLTRLRLEAKRRMRVETRERDRHKLDAMQSSLKILINSFYGYLGYGRGLFNDYRKADEVTKTGQELLRFMIAHIQSRGGQVVEVDTDGVFFVPPPDVAGEAAELGFIGDLSGRMPEGITVALDGRYEKMLSYKKKNYALLGYDGRITIKGSSLTSRSMERFGRRYITECIDRMLYGDIGGLHQLFTSYRQRIESRGLDISDFARVESLRDPLQDYLQEVNAGRRNKSAAYEVARMMGKPYKPGDRVAYYITGSDPNVRSFENCRPAEEWDPNFPDENTRYYLRRLDEFSEKFSPFFRPQDFRNIFSADDLFPFSDKGIGLLTTTVAGEEAEEPGEPRAEEYGIWLDE